MKARHMIFGCLSVPLFLVAIAVGALILALVLGPPDATTTSKSEQQMVSGIPIPTPEAGAPDEVAEIVAAPPKPLRVSVRLEEGGFEIMPAGLGEPIRFEADYIEDLFALEPTFQTDSEGENFSLRFHRRNPFSSLQELVHWRGHDSSSRVSLYLPPGVPMEITVYMRKGALAMDLTGLAVRKLDLDTGMCETTLRFREPNPEILEVLDVKAKMCEFDAVGLGHAAARNLRFDVKMGEFTLDFDGNWTGNAKASVQALMCEVKMRVPQDVRTEFTRKSVIFADLSAPDAYGLLDPETQDQAKTLRLDLAVRMGEVDIR